MKTLFIAITALAIALSATASARGYSHAWGGSEHSGSHGGTYIGGSGSSHKGGHYVGPYGGYGCHKC